jgi:NAD(P)-dependent dehydrogenase (short-subunit alcohol dehydrogenase family)
VAGRLEGRIALVTGASRGIGAAVAERFAREGAQLILVARTVGGLEDLDDKVKAAGGEATLVPLDLTEMDAIDDLGRALFERFGRVDILVGNHAQLGVLTPLTHLDPPVWQSVIDTNLSSHWRLIRSIDPLLRASGSGRAMFVTSGVARSVFPYWGAYAVSKAAIEMLVKTYAAEAAQSGIKANLVDPGAIRTEMRAAAFPGEDPETLPPPAAITDVFVDLAEVGCGSSGEVVPVRVNRKLA